VKQKASSNESLNLNTHDEKPLFANDKKQQQSDNSNLGGRIREHEVEKGLSPIVSANKHTDPNAKSKDDVSTSFNRITRHASKVIGRRKKMMYVSKGSTPIEAKLITRTSAVGPTLKLEPYMTSKSKHTNKKVDPCSHDWT
jgi:hypothetical protein